MIRPGADPVAGINEVKPNAFFVSRRPLILLVATFCLAILSIVLCLFLLGDGDKPGVALPANGGSPGEVAGNAGKSPDDVGISSTNKPDPRQNARDDNQTVPPPEASVPVDPAKAASIAKRLEVMEEINRYWRNELAKINQIASHFNLTFNTSDLTDPPKKTFTPLDNDPAFRRAYQEALAARRIYEAACIKFAIERPMESAAP